MDGWVRLVSSLRTIADIDGYQVAICTLKYERAFQSYSTLPYSRNACTLDADDCFATAGSVPERQPHLALGGSTLTDPGHEAGAQAIERLGTIIENEKT
jgi:hypothetical protein